ncbi:hypothetical protein ACJ73_07125 [Blastomyces percursus]|uniref:Uncharacterized protein n=1 Tax=Blastomyces percursus TaxID=1658174 RepID=A0A1J9R0G3_9EURO|nr:hypothetical protein ACJ73_07125 [Blastomyces percursus]
MQASTPTGIITQRVSILRQSCLIRDHHRCAVTRRGFEYLEVAHILPHSLNPMASGNTELSDSKNNVIQILSMFEPGITDLIEGQDIDSQSGKCPDVNPSLSSAIHPSFTIHPYSPQLLKVHRAIALILKLSGTGEYIDNILRDMEDVKVEEDRPTNLGRLLSLRLGGWLRTLAVF